MFKSHVINQILEKFPVQEHDDILNRIGYNLTLQIEELAVELESLETLIKENSKITLRDFSTSMIIRKIGLLLQEMSLKFPMETLESNEMIDFIKISVELEQHAKPKFSADQVDWKDIEEIRNCLIKERTELKRVIQQKQLYLENSLNHYSTQDLKKFADQLEIRLKGLEKRKEFSEYDSLEVNAFEEKDAQETSDQEVTDILKELDSLNKPIELPVMKSNPLETRKSLILMPKPPITRMSPNTPLRRSLRSHSLSRPQTHPINTALKNSNDLHNEIPAPTKPLSQPPNKTRFRRACLDKYQIIKTDKNKLIKFSC